MVQKLAERLQAARGKPVEWDGRLVHMFHDVTLQDGDTLRVELQRVTPARPQALRLKSSQGSVEVSGQVYSDLVLWSDTAPTVIVATARAAGSGASMQLRMWNAWRDPAGTMQAWIGNSGLLVEGEIGEGLNLNCSDGFDEPDFDDLVVTVRVTR